MKQGRLIAAGALQVPGRLLNTPLLVSATEADLILAAARGETLPAHLFFDFDDGPVRDYALRDGVAIIPVVGGLTYRGYGWFWRQSYNDIRAMVRAALADDQVHAILLDIDSPGGEAAGVFDLVDEIHAARGQKPLHAIANENAFSAAYAIASAADRIHLPRTGAVGSVGVIAVHFERSAAEQKAGYKFTAIYAGAHKNDFSPHEPLSDAARATAQASVDRTWALFVDTVARNRGLSTDAVRAQQAAIFDGADAVAAGLADEVADFETVMAKIARRDTYTLQTGGSSMELTQVKAALEAALADPATTEAADATLTQLGFARVDPQANEQAEQALAAARQQGADAATDSARQIVEKVQLAGLPLSVAGQLIGEKIGAEQAGARILEMRSQQDPGRGLDNSNSGTAPGSGDYLLADAKRRAEAAAH